MLKKIAKKSEVKRPLGRPKLICEDNIKMKLGETGCEGMSWIEVTEASPMRYNAIGFLTC
jgi:hypothetical protein